MDQRSSLRLFDADPRAGVEKIYSLLAGFRDSQLPSGADKLRDVPPMAEIFGLERKTESR